MWQLLGDSWEVGLKEDVWQLLGVALELRLSELVTELEGVKEDVPQAVSEAALDHEGTLLRVPCTLAERDTVVHSVAVIEGVDEKPLATKENDLFAEAVYVGKGGELEED